MNFGRRSKHNEQPKLGRILWLLLNTRLALPMLLLVLVAAAAVGLVVGHQHLTAQATVAEGISRWVEDYLDQASLAVGTLAGVAETSPADVTATYMEAAWRTYDIFDLLYQLDEQGRVVLVTPPDPRYRGLDLSRQPILAVPESQSTTESGALLSQPFTSLHSGQPTLYIAWPLTSGGFIVGELNLGTLQEAVDRQDSAPEAATSFITDRSGTLLAGPQAELVAVQTNVGNLPIVQRGLEKDAARLYRDGDRIVLGSTAQVPSTGWLVVSQVPFRDVYVPYLGLVAIILALSAAIYGGLVLSMDHSLRVRVGAPLAELAQSAEALAAGDFEQVAALSALPPTFREMASLSEAFQHMGRAVHSREQELAYVNDVLHAIRNVNELIVRETDRDRLLQGICDKLITARGYRQAWIALLGPEGQVSDVFYAGSGDLGPTYRRLLQQSDEPDCLQRAWATPDVVLVKDLASECSRCPLLESHAQWQVMVRRLEHDQQIYGVLSVSIPARTRKKAEEQALFAEVCADVSYALRALDAAASRQEAERALVESERRYRELFENIRDGWVQTDLQGVFQACNQAYEEMIGYSLNELKTLTYPQLTPEKWHEMEAQIVNDLVMERGYSGLYEKEYIRKDGTVFPVEFNTYLLRDDQGEPVGMWGLVRDITERVRTREKLWEYSQHLQEMVDAQTEELRQVNEELTLRSMELRAKNKEMETFTYSVSHDLKAPLRGIDGYSRLLLEDYGERLDEEGQRFLETIRQATKQMHQLIDDLLSYSRLERHRLEIQALEVRSLVDSLLTQRAMDLEAKGFEVTVDLPQDKVAADHNGLTLALRNLLDNAIKFAAPDNAPRIEIGGRAEDSMVVLWVRDNGIGFDMRYHDRIFGIFQRLHRAEDYAGTGVGLAIVRKALERMEGRAWAESEPGQGATFYLEIPQ